MSSTGKPGEDQEAGDTARGPAPYSAGHDIGARLERLARWVAIAGGMLLIGVVLMTVISVLGRYLFNAPIPGDYELTELACGIAVFAFFPYCHARNGNIVVEFFTGGLPTRHKTALGTVHNIAFYAGRRPDHVAPVRGRHAQARGRRDDAVPGHPDPLGLLLRAAWSGIADRDLRPGGLPPRARLEAMTSIEFGGLLFGVCLVLIALRMPVAVAMFVVGGFGFASLAGWSAFLNLLNTAPFGRVSSYTLSVLAAVPADGSVGDTVGAQPRAVRCGTGLGRPPPRRTGRLHRLRVRRVRLDLRVLDRDRSDDGLGRAARDAAPRLFRGAGHRHAGGRGNARHSDTAVRDPGDLRGHHGAVGRQALPGGAASGTHRNARLRDRDRRLCPAQARGGAGRAGPAVPRAHPQPGRGVAGGGDLLRGHRRDLFRRVHADRGGRDRGCGDRPGRARLRASELVRLRIEPARDRAGHRDDLPHPDQRRDLQQLPRAVPGHLPRWRMRWRPRGLRRYRSWSGSCSST